MASRRSEEFRHEAVRLALTSGLTRTQIAANLGVRAWRARPMSQRQRDDMVRRENDPLDRF